jgi:hypothetical protein
MPELKNGLVYFKQLGDWCLTQKLEQEAITLLALLRTHSSSPTEDMKRRAKLFLIDVERWKQMCMEEKAIHAVKNSPDAVWMAFLAAERASLPQEQLLAIMNLKGFGASKDNNTGKRRAKQATAVLRFFFPQDWGVVDWRTIAFLCAINLNSDFQSAIDFAKKQNENTLRSLYNCLDEQTACAINQKYQQLKSADFPRTADVEMAIFGWSSEIWPFPPK